MFWALFSVGLIFLLRRTVYGKRLYAIGNNVKASYLSGVPVRRELVATYTLCGLCAGIGGIMLTGTLTVEHVRAIGRQLRNLPGFGSADPTEHAEYATHCAEVLAKVVPFAATHTPGESGRKTRVLVTAIDPVCGSMVCVHLASPFSTAAARPTAS